MNKLKATLFGFVIFFIIVLGLSVYGYFYGLQNDIIWVKDISQELISPAAIGLIVALLFKKVV